MNRTGRGENFVIVLLVIAVALTAGCEPLRKKFSRKKKKVEETAESLPILDPVDYPDKIETPDVLYKKQYSLWRVWHKDLVRIFEDNGNEKRLTYTVDQMLEQMAGMEKFLTGESKTRFSALIADIKTLREEFGKPAALRNKAALTTKIMKFEKEMRAHFRVDKIFASPAVSASQ